MPTYRLTRPRCQGFKCTARASWASGNSEHMSYKHYCESCKVRLEHRDSHNRRRWYLLAQVARWSETQERERQA